MKKIFTPKTGDRKQIAAFLEQRDPDVWSRLTEREKQDNIAAEMDVRLMMALSS